MATAAAVKTHRVKTKRDGTTSKPIVHKVVTVPQTVSQRLNAAVKAGLIEGTGGKLPKPQYRPVNHGKSLSDMIIEDRG